MSETNRTVQITLPKFQWKIFYSRPFLALIALAFGAALGTYWWKEVRPFARIAGAVVQIPIRELVAEQEGKISECFAGDGFSQGQVLVSMKDAALVAERTQVAQKCEERQREMESLQSRLDQNMQQYLYLQSEVEAEIGPTELTGQILAEIQTLQDRVQRVEQEVKTLESSRKLLDQKLSGQNVGAPFDGIVLQWMKGVGDRVKAGDRLCVIGDQEHPWIDAVIEEAMLAGVGVGSLAQIELVSSPGRQYAGTVSWISPRVGEGKVKIRLTAEGLPARSGLSATLRLKVR